MTGDRTFGQVRTEIILRERMKELDCLHSIAETIERTETSIEDCFRAAMEFLPKAFLYPEISCGRLRFRDVSYQADGFLETPWMIGAELRLHGEPAGSIEVCYKVERPTRDHGPFMEEERLLLETAARILGTAVEVRLLREERNK